VDGLKQKLEMQEVCGKVWQRLQCLVQFVRALEIVTKHQKNGILGAQVIGHFKLPFSLSEK